jgi:hypothetical protein
MPNQFTALHLAGNRVRVNRNIGGEEKGNMAGARHISYLFPFKFFNMYREARRNCK